MASSVFPFSSPMSPSPAQDEAPRSIASSSCFALACHVWILCLLPVVLVFSSVTVAAVFVVILPFACMAACFCLVCAIAALLLAPCFAPPDGEAEPGGSDNYGDSSREEEKHEGEAELRIRCCQECSAAYAAGARFSDPCGDEQEQFFWVDTGNYYSYRKFYDLLAFWRRKERTGTSS